MNVGCFIGFALTVIFSAPVAAESLLAKEAVAAVRERLIDADSARFKIDHERGRSICGQVNAKNRFGGYTGYNLFLYTRAASKDDGPTLHMFDPTVKPTDGLTRAAVDNLIVEAACGELSKVN